MIPISIIMPVYNSEKYIEKAITSILNQSFSDFELIIVDDGSTDNSGSICKRFAQEDNRVKYVRQNNGGISNARNTGLSIATGEYITFADNDDEFTYKLLEENYALAKRFNADIVKYGVSYYTIKHNKTEQLTLRNHEKEVLNKDEIRNSHMKLKNQHLLVYVWDAFFKRELINNHNIRFNEAMKYGGEDIFFNLSILPFTETMVINPKEYYIHYKRDSHSTVMHFNENKLNSYIINAQFEYDYIKNNCKGNSLKEILGENIALHLIQIVMAIIKLDIKQYKKIIMLKKVTKESPFRESYSFTLIKKIYKKNKKRGIVLFLHNYKLYRILYCLIQRYINKN